MANTEGFANCRSVRMKRIASFSEALSASLRSAQAVRMALSEAKGHTTKHNHVILSEAKDDWFASLTMTTLRSP